MTGDDGGDDIDSERDASDDDTNMASSPVSRGAMDRSVENDDHDDANPDDAIDDPDDGASWLAAA